MSRLSSLIQINTIPAPSSGPTAFPAALELWTTEAVLIEVGNAFSARNRSAAVNFIRQFYQTSTAHVVPITTDLLSRALSFYESHHDKA